MSFAYKFQDWCTERAIAEFSNDFPLLRNVKGRATSQFIEFAGGLYEDELEIAARGFSRRFNIARVVPAPVLDHKEQSLVDRYLNFYSCLDKQERRFVDAKGSRAEQDFEAAREKEGRRISVRGMSVQIEKRLQNRIGTLVSGNKSSLMYEFRYSKWSIRTSIDINSSRAEVDFSQSIGPADQPHVISCISTCSLLGISSQTSWNLFFEDEIDQVASQLTDHATFLCDGYIF